MSGIMRRWKKRKEKKRDFTLYEWIFFRVFYIALRSLVLRDYSFRGYIGVKRYRRINNHHCSWVFSSLVFVVVVVVYILRFRRSFIRVEQVFFIISHFFSSFHDCDFILFCAWNLFAWSKLFPASAGEWRLKRASQEYLVKNTTRCWWDEFWIIISEDLGTFKGRS